jgi:hypothetical protein
MLRLDQRMGRFEVRTIIGMQRAMRSDGAFILGQRPIGEGLFEFVVGSVEQKDIDSPEPARAWMNATYFTQTLDEPPIYGGAAELAWDDLMNRTGGYTYRDLNGRT